MQLQHVIRPNPCGGRRPPLPEDPLSPVPPATDRTGADEPYAPATAGPRGTGRRVGAGVGVMVGPVAPILREGVEARRSPLAGTVSCVNAVGTHGPHDRGIQTPPGYRVAALGLLLLAWMLAGCGDSQPDNHALVAAVAAGRPAEVTVQGRVVQVLPDDEGPQGRHQRFRLQVAGQIVELDLQHVRERWHLPLCGQVRLPAASRAACTRGPSSASRSTGSLLKTKRT